MQLQDYDISTQYGGQVLSNQRLTPPNSKEEVRELMIEVDTPDFRAFVGQNIGVLAPGQSDLGQSYHLRLYSIADVPRISDAGRQQFQICVRRCSYIDQFSGEEYPGIASNFLCDLAEGGRLTVVGPYGQAFSLPKEPEPNLILIGAGTGIAPFRAFVKHIYQRRPDFRGRIFLLHGAHTGLELLYRNDEKDDFAYYYDRETFEAVDALSKRPGWTQEIDWSGPLRHRGEELCRLLSDTRTYVYLAGLVKIRDELCHALSDILGSSEEWDQWKAQLEADGRWTELLY